jgi:hypothetical protein
MGDRRVKMRQCSLKPRRGSTLVSVGIALTVVGCGNMIYAVNANAAADKLEEARELGAARLAPYEYYYAKEHLLKARQEAAEADYGDAAELAAVSEEYSLEAIRVARSAKGVEGQ